ncbi:hypothetical protein [Aquabacterium sp. J223]|uniref:hypothetical protein n=1 Tax=Aquabacterium sp. J223 TaxID=2898431 RepID=UPI0021ADB9AA|nr:hypothetical protein [Aquabacterium sp. J223]UUX97456.1 hypothetical protein LRS07_09575 [Aquabacterium sp. J223]
MNDAAKTEEREPTRSATAHEDVVAAVRAALRLMGLPAEDFELRLFPSAHLGPMSQPERVLSVRRLPCGEPRLFLVADDVPWLIQLVGDLCEGRL